MKGKYSDSDFFKLYPSIIRSCFQGSITTTSRGVLNIFRIAKEKLESFIKEKGENNNKKNESKIKKNELPISLIFFEELGLAEKSKDNPLKVLHSKLEYDDTISKEKKIAFVGISNWSLDASKMNRAIFLYVPEFTSNIDNVSNSMESIVESIDTDILKKYKNVFDNLSKAYFDFKDHLYKNESKYFDSLSSRDFYYLIKNCANKIKIYI